MADPLWTLAKNTAAQVIQAKKDYAAAEARGDETGMLNAHAVAERAREILENSGYDWVAELVDEDKTLQESESAYKELKTWSAPLPGTTIKVNGQATVPPATSSGTQPISLSLDLDESVQAVQQHLSGVNLGWLGIGVVVLIVLRFVKGVLE